MSGNTELVTKALGHLYGTKAVLFGDKEAPNQFAQVFLEKLNQGTGKVAELGSGNGRDSLSFAEHGYDVVSFELDSTCREKTREKFGRKGLGKRLTLRDNFYETDGIAEASLVGVYGYSSLHYVDPLEMTKVLKVYGKLLRKDGIIGLGLKDRKASFYQDHVNTGKRPEEHFDVGRIAGPNGVDDRYVHGIHFQIPGDGGKITRWFYTPSQLRTILRGSGFEVLDCSTREFADYGRQGKTESFTELILRPGN